MVKVRAVAAVVLITRQDRFRHISERDSDMEASQIHLLVQLLLELVCAVLIN